jgi:hypothetical protein
MERAEDISEFEGGCFRNLLSYNEMSHESAKKSPLRNGELFLRKLITILIRIGMFLGIVIKFTALS